VLLLIHTLCSSLQHILSLLSVLCLHRLSPGKGFQCRSFISFRVHVFTGRRLSPNWVNSSRSQSHIATDGLSVRKSCFEPHLGFMTRYLLLFNSYGLVFCEAPSLTRRRVCLLYMLLVLASAVFLGSESLGSRDHILLSQI
jgi:hypothetical protein